jgi:hypothetical protein
MSFLGKESYLTRWVFEFDTDPLWFRRLCIYTDTQTGWQGAVVDEFHK